ncbi:hypothetical protein FOL47_001187 [Perkinsus chesapeaki]|uniref:Uncharacterized protein n=1 Tax=Perkinsus chesapeaki TaxID=330153 RepID=A0A7J6MK03_PERCH|nr:hypothetical protein FOL47_001187 [Perkinsus chesapeaki]
MATNRCHTLQLKKLSSSFVAWDLVAGMEGCPESKVDEAAFQRRSRYESVHSRRLLRKNVAKIAVQSYTTTFIVMPSSPTSPELHEYNGNYGKAQRALKAYYILSARKLTVWFAIWFVASCILGCPPPGLIHAGVYEGSFSGNTMHMNVPKEAETESSYMMPFGFRTKKGNFTCEPTLCQTIDITRCTLVSSCTSKIHEHIGLSPHRFDFWKDGCKFYVQLENGPQFEVKLVQ